ncbi:hypothetical protein [Streptomyces sp. NPDC101149]
MPIFRLVRCPAGLRRLDVQVRSCVAVSLGNSDDGTAAVADAVVALLR